MNWETELINTFHNLQDSVFDARESLNDGDYKNIQDNQKKLYDKVELQGELVISLRTISHLLEKNLEHLTKENEKLKFEARKMRERAERHLQRYYDRMDENEALKKEIEALKNDNEKLAKKGQKILEILNE